MSTGLNLSKSDFGQKLTSRIARNPQIKIKDIPPFYFKFAQTYRTLLFLEIHKIIYLLKFDDSVWWRTAAFFLCSKEHTFLWNYEYSKEAHFSTQTTAAAARLDFTVVCGSIDNRSVLSRALHFDGKETRIMSRCSLIPKWLLFLPFTRFDIRMFSKW